MSTLNVHLQQRARHGIKACCKNDDVQIEFSAAGFDASRRDALYGRITEVDQIDMRCIEGFEITAVNRRALCSKRMVYVAKLLCLDRIGDSLANFVAYEICRCTV